MPDYDQLNEQIIQCRQCPRLVEWRERIGVEKRKSFQDEAYWAKPVPNFGDPQANGLIVGLAPAAHGANRTGRQFTGDRSGDWLYRSLHRVGFANQPNATHIGDGLELKNIIVTPICHCAPPDNKPTREEIANCKTFLDQTLALRDWRALLCLGNIGWTELHKALAIRPIPKFTHGVESQLPDGRIILASFHPSQQNTFTGRLTEEMLDAVVQRFWDLLHT